jgi:hypothetical protein
VRSAAVFHGIGCDASLSSFARDRREGEAGRPGPEAVKDTILVEVQTNRVSIPSASASAAGAETGRGLLAMRAGRVKERRAAALETGRRSGVLESCGGDMADSSGEHGCPTGVKMRGALNSRGVGAGSVEVMDGAGIASICGRAPSNARFQADPRAPSSPSSYQPRVYTFQTSGAIDGFRSAYAPPRCM